MKYDVRYRVMPDRREAFEKVLFLSQLKAWFVVPETLPSVFVVEGLDLDDKKDRAKHHALRRHSLVHWISS